MFRDLHHDAKLLMFSRGIRAFAFSYLGVVFAIYLTGWAIRRWSWE